MQAWLRDMAGFEPCHQAGGAVNETGYGRGSARGRLSSALQQRTIRVVVVVSIYFGPPVLIVRSAHGRVSGTRRVRGTLYAYILDYYCSSVATAQR